MAEYRIVAKIDPQTAAGSQKVKQDLRGIQTEAKATETALNRSFDQAKFDKTVGGLVGRIDQLDKSLTGVGGTSQRTGKQFDSTTGSIERMTAAEFRAAGGMDGLNKAAKGAQSSNAQLEAALRRVLSATDTEAAEQLRLNMLLADAKKLLDAGVISTDRYAQVQNLAAGTAKNLNVVTGSQRIGMQQLGFQLGDVATMYSLGAKPAQIFGSQIGQVSQALMLMGGGASGGLLAKVGGFLAGPWGIAVTLGAILLGPMVAKLLESNNALDDQVKKLKDDARESELTRQAHERWINTLDALIERQGRLADAMKDRLKVQGVADESDLRQATRDRTILEGQLADEKRRLADLQRQLTEASRPVEGAGTIAGQGAQGVQAGRVSALQAQIKEANTQIGILDQSIKDAQTRIVGGQILVGEQQGKAMVDLAAKASLWGDKYQAALRGIFTRNDELRAQTPQVTAGFEEVRTAVDRAASAGLNFSTTMDKARNLGVALEEGKLSASGYRIEMAKLATALTAAAKAAEDAKRKTSDGVATFVSARQAIGIAGREFQQAGFKVSENSQFGGVTPGVHSGAGHAQDRAADINFGSGVVEANVPDIRERLDAMAKRYAARGYIVLWNGKRYDPSGKVTSIPGGQDQHRDHLHLEAPGTIVGKPTQASTEEQARQEENAQAKVAERAGDFVQSIVDKSAKVGLPANSQSQLNAQIDEALAEFKRRFDREATTGEKATISKAFTDADARATAQRFDEAYVQPLKRLQDLQGKTGIDRAVLNAQLEETLRLGRELTPVEKQTIENGIRNGDQLSRQAQILQQIKGPLQEYAETIKALNALLAQGAINQTSYNARIAELGNTAAQASFQGLQGVDPGTGQQYQDLSAVSDENARYAKQLEDFQTYRDQLLQMGVDYDALELAAATQHQQNLAKIDQARKDVTLAGFQEMAAGVTSAMKAMFGEQSRAYKAAFAVEKAVAIARAIVAIQTGIAQASALPFPANIPAIASVIAATASIISNIQAVALNFKDGGRVRGPGGPRSDSIPANLSRDEFVVNAHSANRNRSLLEAINDGRDVRQVGRARASENARIVAMQAPPVNVTAQAADVHVVVVDDPRKALLALGTAEGKKALVEVIESDPNTFRRLLGTA